MEKGGLADERRDWEKRYLEAVTSRAHAADRLLVALGDWAEAKALVDSLVRGRP